MNSTITITPVTNIRNLMVVDNSLVTKETHDSDMSSFKFRNIRYGQTRMGNLMSVSLYDDVIVREEGEYKILHMHSK